MDSVSARPVRSLQSVGRHGDCTPMRRAWQGACPARVLQESLVTERLKVPRCDGRARGRRMHGVCRAHRASGGAVTGAGGAHPIRAPAAAATPHAERASERPRAVRHQSWRGPPSKAQLNSRIGLAIGSW